MKNVAELEKKLGNNKVLRVFVIVVAIGIPLFLALSSIFFGHVSLWYDNARDLMSAWNNLSKPTLIGPTSGIPGIFYGPYWIWLLSVGVAVSKDPVIVVFVTALLPYFIIFSLIWFRFAKFFGLKAVVIGWLLFMTGTGLTYATQLWNPFPAPLLTLIVIYLLIISSFKEVTKKQVVISLATGFFLGLVINFHISFGLGLLCGVLIFLLWDCIRSWLQRDKKTVKHFLLSKITLYSAIGAGFMIAYLPTLLFEVRHGFQQTLVLIETFTKFGDVVTVKGLTKPLIIQEFINTFGKVLHVSAPYVTGIIVLLPLLVGYLAIRRKLQLTQVDKRIGILLLSLLSGVVFIYMTAKNPVWEYHFISVDVIFLVLLVWCISKIRWLNYVAAVWMIVAIASTLFTHFTTFNYNSISGLDDQKTIVTKISADAKDENYVVMSHNTAIYMYDYSYLFKWLVGKDVPYDPSTNPASDVIYLVIPKEDDPKVQDFIKFRTPEATYTTADTWDFEYSRVLKRERM